MQGNTYGCETKRLRRGNHAGVNGVEELSFWSQRTSVVNESERQRKSSIHELESIPLLNSLGGQIKQGVIYRNGPVITGK